MGYECLLTGLPEAGALSMEALEEQLEESLKDKDKEQLRLLKLRSREGACSFVLDWLDFTKAVNNALTAEVCRKHGLDPNKYIIGEMPDEIAPEVKNVSKETDLYQREHLIDALYLAWLDERTEMITFSLENVLAYYLKTQIMNRWNDLTPEKGEGVFREMVKDMKKGVKL